MNTLSSLSKMAVSKYLLREENNGYLLYLPESEKTYSVNQTGLTIIQALSRGENLQDIVNHIKNNHLKTDDVEAQITMFLSDLLYLGVIRNSNGSDTQDTQPYNPPTIMLLEELYEKGAQCRIFGMP